MHPMAIVQSWLRYGPHGYLTLSLGALISCNEVSVSGYNSEVQEIPILVESFVQAPLPKVDILWVVDNSLSMASEHQKLQDALEPFMEELEEADIAWQLGVVGTDLEDADQALLRGEPWVMSPALDDPLSSLQLALDVGTEGRGPSGGLAVATMALSEPLRSGANRGFRRNDASLHVIVFSDSDDESSTVLGDDPATTFIEFLEEESLLDGQAVLLSAIVGDPDTGCLGPGGSALPGDTYLAVSQATGGSNGSICETDFSGLLAHLGETSITWQVRFELQASPVEDSLRVSVDGIRLDSGWWLEAETPAVVFIDPPAPGANIEVRYEMDP